MARDRALPEAGSAGRRSSMGLVFAGTVDAVRGTLETVRGGLRELKVPPETCGIVEIVLAEALNNIVEHAYAGIAPGMIELDLERRENALAFEIRDRGRPMPGGSAPDGAPHDLDVPAQELPEGGFGWHLIHSLTVDLNYRRTDAGNALRFCIPITGGANLH